MVDFFIFLAVAVVSIIAVRYLKSNLIKFRNQLDRQLNDPGELHKFSCDIFFDPFPEEIRITNAYPCDSRNLRPCTVGDFRTCIGCKNLTATCQHFNTDTLYYHYDGCITMIPKNNNPTEGYCMSVKKLNDVCNPYHGDLVLMQLDSDSQDSMLICDCKYPGYIGKTTIQGNCNNAHICNGNVKDLNKSLEELECNCSDGYISSTTIPPFCKPMLVSEYDNFDSLTFTKRSAAAEAFHKDINGNYAGHQLLDPCGFCVLTGKSVNGRQLTAENTVQCVANDNTCLPIRLAQHERILKGAEGPDAMVAIEWDQILILGHIDSSNYHNIAVKFSYTKNREIYKLLNLNSNNSYFINMLDHQAVFPGSFKPIDLDSVPVGYCKGEWPTYNCNYSLTSNKFGFKTYKPNHSTLRLYNGRSIPDSFWWATEFWSFVELKMNPSVNIIEPVNHLPHLSINENLRGQSELAVSLRFMYLIYDNASNRLAMINTSSKNDYTRFTSKLVKYT